MSIPYLSGLVFETLPDDETDALLDRLRELAPQRLAKVTIRQARSAVLPCYHRHRLLDLELGGVTPVTRAFVLASEQALFWLDGTSTPVHAANDLESLALTPVSVLAYVRFFLFAVRGGDGSFVLVEDPAAIDSAQVPAEALPGLQAGVRPLALVDAPAATSMQITATLAYGGTLFHARFVVEASGSIEMTDDEVLGALPATAVSDYPALPPLPRGGLAVQAVAVAAALGKPPGADAAPPSDRRVTEGVVSVLLAEAAVAKIGHRLLQRFNSQAGGADPLLPLVRFVREFTPVVLIESEIAFIEEIAAGLLDPEGSVFVASAVRRAGAAAGDDAACVVDPDSRGARLHLLSFHAYRRLWDAEWTAHRLAIGEATVLIGCDRRQDVPEPLRRVADLVLSLPRIDTRLFPAIFQRVFGAPPPPDWAVAGDEWTRYLLHTDFHAPRRLGLALDEAVTYLRERCLARLAQVSASDSPRLEDLHGLGEARQVAEDLIADIAAARAGRIPWSAVDRGLLLVGPPGTGKTTLARAIARACGVKFLTASAAQWQAAGSLDSHLRAIRETFAEARRYAPAILFIDEIDSLGSRETLSGPNAMYQTEVINAVLEQMQGLDPEEPVMVLAATNYADKVDPALRRAGRLDQVVSIPRPSVAALARIFAFHLARQVSPAEIGADVDLSALAPLAFGLTGADVEFFVRGAARRARKAGRPLSQEDLLAEVTRRPRHADPSLRLGPEVMRRVAVHEAGHALSALHDDHGDDVTFVSIIPRNDGSLGFTATPPRESLLDTYPAVLGRLRTLLAGRAAEAVIYGERELSLGSGGGPGSDLAVATRIATHLVCATGFGEGGSLQWTDAPTASQRRQVDQLLRRAYRAALVLMRAQRAALLRLADALVAEQELSGARARELLVAASEEAAQPRRRRKPLTLAR